MTEEDVEIYKGWQASPIAFICDMWDLTPQPVKREYWGVVNKLIEDGQVNQLKVEYFEPFIKNQHITWQQWQILLGVELALQGKASRQITVVSGHGTGKSCVLSWLLIWQLFCFEDAQIPCTAPTSRQMHDILWKEVNLWLGKMPKEIQALFEWSNNYVRVVERRETWFARATTASKENSEALAGVHGNHVMIIVDEASGVYEEIYNTAAGSMTGPNVLVILTSNGTRLMGYFFDTHHKDAGKWQTFSLNAEESPIVDVAFVRGIVDKHGKESDEYSIRVAGGFGKEEGVDEQGFVPLFVSTDLREAKTTELLGRVRLGIDPAGDGSDEMAQVARDNFIAKVIALEKKSSTKSIASTSVSFIKAHDINGDDVAADNFGVGANVPQEIALADQKEPIRIKGVNVGDPADDPERFMNKRAELAWRAYEWVKAGGEFVGLEKFKEELLSIRFRRTAGGKSRIQLMDKKTMRKLGLNHSKSPNRFDAFILTFNNPETIAKKYFQPEAETISDYEG